MKTTTIYNKVIFVSLFLLAACTEVELCTEETHPHTANFSVDYKWKSEYYNPAMTTEAETSMHFVVSRILNTRHYVYTTDRDGLFRVKKQTEPTPEPETPDGNIPTGREEGQEGLVEYEWKSSIPMANGEYFMMSFTKPTEQSNTTVPRNKIEVNNLEQFQEDNSIGANKIVMQHANARASELIKRSWEDLNPGYGYVFEPGEEDLYIARCNYLELHNTKQDYKQLFVFEPLFQEIEINFTIDFIKEENGEALNIPLPEAQDRVIAEMSGIVPKVNLSNGILNTTETKKMILNVSETSRTEDNTKITVSYKATFKAFGLIGGVDSQTISGPGVFRLGIYLKDPNSLREKAARVLSNLSAKITNERLTELTGQPHQRKKLKDKASFTIESHIVVKMSVFNENSNDGISGWITEGNNVDVEA